MKRHEFIKENAIWWQKHLVKCQELAAACVRRSDSADTDAKLQWLDLARHYQAQAQKAIEHLDKLRAELG